VRLLRFVRPQARWSRGARHVESRRGFTMIEMLTVAMVIGTLARMATPEFHGALLKARAAGVAGDFETVRVAVLNYHADHLEWPPDGYPGQVPKGLAPYLPDNFSFVRQGYRLDWENWILHDGLPKHPESGALLGISIVTTDRELGQAAVDLLGGGMGHYTLGSTYTFIIERI